MATYHFVHEYGAYCVFVNGKIIAKCKSVFEARKIADDYNQIH